ncbi:hypothetical protein [Actinophytocola oryzae]|uniref:hypothetical protein n=1 Tax=Actinophytocola oryzae TaxID=502181 RepID=UPI0010638A78|nr:hypothetical protein [Actinophytocola oryzae]
MSKRVAPRAAAGRGVPAGRSAGGTRRVGGVRFPPSWPTVLADRHDAIFRDLLESRELEVA